MHMNVFHCYDLNDRNFVTEKTVRVH